MFDDFKINYHFKNYDLLELALTHSSYAHENNLHSNAHNERLEFLGDAVLEVVISETLYCRFPHFDEGQLTKFRASLVCEGSLAKLAHSIELSKYLKLGKGEESIGGRQRDALLADAFEAVIGAVFMDGGFENAKTYILGFFDEEIKEQSNSFETADYKTFLQEALQKSVKQPARYTITNEAGPAHDKTFTADVSLNNSILGSGSGKTKKEAEQNAAEAALSKLGLKS